MLQSKKRLLELNSKLADTLIDKGVAASADETTTALVDKVSDISGGYYNTGTGKLYTKNMVLSNLNANTTVSSMSYLYDNCQYLESVEMSGGNISGSSTGVFRGCSYLKSAKINNVTVYGHYWFRGCTKLTKAQLGSIGFPVTGIAIYSFYDCTQSELEITIYVDAETLAEIPTTISDNSPFGATNATIIYRNSTTGEVITA